MEDLHHIIECHRKALEIYTENNFPFEWGDIHIKIANCYIELADNEVGDSSEIEYLKTAITYLGSANRIYSWIEYPEKYAKNIARIGELYLQMAIITEDESIQKKYCQMAVDCFRDALNHYSENEFPIEWAEIQKKLADAYGQYPYPEDDIEWKQDHIISFLRESLRVYTKHEYPDKYADTQTEIGHFYYDMGYLISACKAYSLAIWAYRSLGDESTADDVDRIRKNIINTIYSKDYEIIKQPP